MTLKSLIDDDVSDVFLQTDDFAESVTFVPKEGDPREITAVIEERTALADEGDLIDSDDEIEVFVARDSTIGIDDPQLGDALKRSGDGDDEKWSFTGDVVEADASAMKLIFRRPKTLRIGTTQTRR